MYFFGVEKMASASSAEDAAGEESTTAQLINELSEDETRRLTQELLGDSLDYSQMSGDALIQLVETTKQRGNDEYKRGTALAKHSAGKAALAEACKYYYRVSSPVEYII